MMACIRLVDGLLTGWNPDRADMCGRMRIVVAGGACPVGAVGRLPRLWKPTVFTDGKAITVRGIGTLDYEV